MRPLFLFLHIVTFSSLWSLSPSEAARGAWQKIQTTPKHTFETNLHHEKRIHKQGGLNQKGTTVCIHGFLQTSRRMMAIGNELKNEGLDIILWDYPTWRKTIEEHAADLVCLLKRIAIEKPGEPINFVTHSMGGLITRAAIAHRDCPEEAKIGKAVLLAPPNKGSCLGRSFKDNTAVRWFFGPNAGCQLLDYSVDEMDALGSFPEGMDVYVLAGEKGSRLFFSVPNDGKVTINETYLSTPHTHISINANHTWIIRSRETIRVVKTILVERYQWSLPWRGT